MGYLLAVHFWLCLATLVNHFLLVDTLILDLVFTSNVLLYNPEIVAKSN